MGFHWYELLPLLLIGILFFGPKRLPEMGAAVGKTIREFQNSMHHIEEPEQAAAQPATLAATTATTAAEPLPAAVAFTETPAPAGTTGEVVAEVVAE